MTKKVVSISDATGDARMWDAEMMLQSALQEVREGQRSAKKALILWLEDDDDSYMVGFTQCGMTIVECILLCEMGKDRLKQARYDDDE